MLTLISVGIFRGKANINAYSYILMGQILIAFFTFTKSLTYSYSFLLTLTITIFVPMICEIINKPLYNKLNLALLLQVVFIGFLYFDYRLGVYSVVDAYYYEIAIALTITQTMAAINGDTGFINSLLNRCAGFISDLASNIFNHKKEQPQ